MPFDGELPIVQADALKQLATSPTPSHMARDWLSPDLERVLADIVRQRVDGRRRERSRALFDTLAREWERLGEKSETTATYFYYSWRSAGTVPLVREPFGSAEMPGKLHFPYNESGKTYAPFPNGASPVSTDLGPADLPYALPNVMPGNFFALRGFRNDLTHNMTSGHIQPICWIGSGTGQIIGIPIR